MAQSQVQFYEKLGQMGLVAGMDKAIPKPGSPDPRSDPCRRKSLTGLDKGGEKKFNRKMMSLILSVIAYYASSWYCGRLLKEYLGLEKGFAKGFYCFMAGVVVSLAVGGILDAVFPSQAINPFALMGGASPVGAGSPSTSDVKEVQDALKALYK